MILQYFALKVLILAAFIRNTDGGFTETFPSLTSKFKVLTIAFLPKFLLEFGIFALYSLRKLPLMITILSCRFYGLFCVTAVLLFQFSFCTLMSAQDYPFGMQLGPITEITSEQPWRNAALNSRVSRNPEKGLGMMTVYLDEENPEWDSGPVIPDSLIDQRTGFPLYAPVMVDDRPVGGQLVLFYDWRPCDSNFGGALRWTANSDLELTVEGTGVVVFKGLDVDCNRQDTIVTPVTRLPICVNKGVYRELEALEIYIIESDSDDPINHLELFDASRTIPWWNDDREDCCDYDLCCRSNHDSSFWMTNWLQVIIDPMDVIKFGHWGRTFCNPLVSWEDRVRPEYFSMGHKKGVAYEYWIDLANFMQKDIWINVPHQANDAFIDSMALLFSSELDTSLHVYLEYSSEIWSPEWNDTTCLDSMRSQLHFAAIHGEGATPEERRNQWIVSRSQFVFQRFNKYFDSTRITRVLALPSRDYALADSILSGFAGASHDSLDYDAMAISPVLGWDFEVMPNYCFSYSASLLDRLENDMDSVFNQMAHFNDLAEESQKQLLAYATPYDVPLMNCPDDSQHWEGWRGAHYARVNALYCEYMMEWYNLTDGLLIFDMSVSRYDRREEDEGDLVFETHMKGFQRCTTIGIAGPHGRYFLAFDFCPILPIFDIYLYQDSERIIWKPRIEGHSGDGFFILQYSSAGSEFIDLIRVPEDNRAEYSISKNDLPNRTHLGGLYRVIYIDNEDEANAIISNVIRIAQSHDLLDVSLMPNPVDEQFSIYFSSESEILSLTVYNFLGNQVAIDLLSSSPFQNQYSCLDLPPGLYFATVSILQGEQQITKALPFIKS